MDCTCSLDTLRTLQSSGAVSIRTEATGRIVHVVILFFSTLSELGSRTATGVPISTLGNPSRSCFRQLGAGQHLRQRVRPGSIQRRRRPAVPRPAQCCAALAATRASVFLWRRAQYSRATEHGRSARTQREGRPIQGVYFVRLTVCAPHIVPLFEAQVMTRTGGNLHFKGCISIQGLHFPISRVAFQFKTYTAIQGLQKNISLISKVAYHFKGCTSMPGVPGRYSTDRRPSRG